MIRDYADRKERVEALTERYRAGEFSERIYRVSLSFLIPEDEVMAMVDHNQKTHRQSLPYRRGTCV